MKPENNGEPVWIADKIIPLVGQLNIRLDGGDYDVMEIIESIRSKLSNIEQLVAPVFIKPSVISDWNSFADVLGLPKCRETSGRESKIRTRMRDKEWASSYLKALSLLKNCPFLIGKNDRGWKANIDWFLQPDSVAKILEGQYSGGILGPSVSELVSKKRALDDEIHTHKENRDGPNFRFGHSTPEGRSAFTALKQRREEITRQISSMNGH
jgi:hypothetical protein